MTEQPDRICILGGGFGGLYTALRLNELPWNPPDKPEIVLVDREDRFVFLPLLYELLTGELQTWEIAPPFVEILGSTSVRFCQDKVTGIDLDDRQVYLGDAPPLSYTRLVLALGGETPVEIVPGAAEHAYPFRSVRDAYRLEERLRQLEQSDADKIRIAVVGGGYSGVELACKLSDRLGDRARLRIIERNPDMLRASPEFNREAARKALEDRGIWIDVETSVESVEADAINLAYKGKVDRLPAELVAWTVGTRVPEVVRSLPVPQNQREQIRVAPTLQVEDRPELFALGDLADCRDAQHRHVPTTAQAAFQQADYAAWNIWASMSDRPLLPFRYQHLGEMMTLGTDNATLTGLGVKLDGPFAHIARRLAYLSRFPTLEHQIKVGLNWIARPLLETLGDL